MANINENRKLMVKQIARAKAELNNVAVLKEAVPFKKFVRDMGHKRGQIRTGRYPVKASQAILKLLESAESNAQAKGLSVPDLYVAHIASQRGPCNYKGSRIRGRKNKSTHVEIVLLEGVAPVGTKKQKKAPAKKAKPAEKKAEPAKVEKPEAKEEKKVEAPAEKAVEKPEEKKAEAKPEEKPAEKKAEEKPEEASQ